MHQVKICPVCKHTAFGNYLDLKDYFLSEESFSILQCKQCSFLLTSPVPDNNELPRYYASDEYISHSAKRKGLINSIYLLARNYTVQSKFRIVDQRVSGKRILDIGCGTGELLGRFKSRGYETSGIEPNEDARKFAAKAYQLDIFNEEAITGFESGRFDAVMMWHVLEHVASLEERIMQIVRIMHKEGTLFVALPNCRSLDAKIYERYWAAWDVPRHLYHFTRDSVEKLFEKCGMAVQEVLPMKLDAFYISMLSEKYRSGKRKFVKGLINGWRSNIFAGKNNNEYSSLIYVIKMGQK